MERTLGSLQRLGVCLVLDDFGVGFSSLGYLKRLPLSIVKLDRSFVENVTDSPNDAAIVRAVSDMAETIGIGVVAEGVENADQVRVARELGCGYAQGFHFSGAGAGLLRRAPAGQSATHVSLIAEARIRG